MNQEELKQKIEDEKNRRWPTDKYMLRPTKESPAVHLGTMEAVQLSMIPEEKRLPVWTDWCIFEKKSKFNSATQRHKARELFMQTALKLIEKGQ